MGQQAIKSLNYWKGKEAEAKMELQDAKDYDKNRRLQVRELRTERRRKNMTLARELAAIEKVFKLADRDTLRMLPPDQRKDVYKMYGFKPEVVDLWVNMSASELERKKKGLD
jgi:hypothetical protein